MVRVVPDSTVSEDAKPVLRGFRFLDFPGSCGREFSMTMLFVGVLWGQLRSVERRELAVVAWKRPESYGLDSPVVLKVSWVHLPQKVVFPGQARTFWVLASSSVRLSGYSLNSSVTRLSSE